MTRRYSIALASLATLFVACAAYPSFAQIGFPKGAPRSPSGPPAVTPAFRTIHLPPGGKIEPGAYYTRESLETAISHANPDNAPRLPNPYQYGVNWNTEMLIVCPAAQRIGNRMSQRVEALDFGNGVCTVSIVVNPPGSDDVLIESQRKQLDQFAIAVKQTNDRVVFKNRTERQSAASCLMRETHGQTTRRDGMTLLEKGDASQMRIVNSATGFESIVDDISYDGNTTRFNHNSGSTSKETVDSLATAARNTGFLDLKECYGSKIPDIDQRTRLLRVTIDGKVKEVLVRDDPANPVPLSFERMWKAFRDARAQVSRSGGSWGGASSGGGSFSGGSWGSSGGSFSAGGGSGSGGFSISGGGGTSASVSIPEPRPGSAH